MALQNGWSTLGAMKITSVMMYLQMLNTPHLCFVNIIKSVLIYTMNIIYTWLFFYIGNKTYLNNFIYTNYSRISDTQKHWLKCYSSKVLSSAQIIITWKSADSFNFTAYEYKADHGARCFNLPHTKVICSLEYFKQNNSVQYVWLASYKMGKLQP